MRKGVKATPTPTLASARSGRKERLSWVEWIVDSPTKKETDEPASREFKSPARRDFEDFTCQEGVGGGAVRPPFPPLLLREWIRSTRAIKEQRKTENRIPDLILNKPEV